MFVLIKISLLLFTAGKVACIVKFDPGFHGDMICHTVNFLHREKILHLLCFTLLCFTLLCFTLLCFTLLCLEELMRNLDGEE
jgi:hypothetical protein